MQWRKTQISSNLFDTKRTEIYELIAHQNQRIRDVIGLIYRGKLLTSNFAVKQERLSPSSTNAWFF